MPNVWQLTIFDSVFFTTISAIVDSKSEGDDSIKNISTWDGVDELTCFVKLFAVPGIWQFVFTSGCGPVDIFIVWVA